MGHHLTDDGRFQSDKYDWCPPDYVAVRVSAPETWPALELLASLCRQPEFAADLKQAMHNAGWRKVQRAGTDR